MKVLDATFLIDYLDGVAATKKFYEAAGAGNERRVMPVPAYAEALVGEGDLPNGNVAGARADRVVRTHFSPVVTAREIRVPNHEVCDSMAVQEYARPDDLSWGEKYEVDERTAVTAGEIADEAGPDGPDVDGLDALTAAVGRELDAPVVSAVGLPARRPRRSSMSRNTDRTD